MDRVKPKAGNQRAELFQSDTTENVQYLPWDIELETTTIKAGEWLYVSLIKIMPKDEDFPPYKLLRVFEKRDTDM